MKTPQEWMDAHGYDDGVCCGHGDFQTLPRRLTLELVARVQADAKPLAGENAIKACNVIRALQGRAGFDAWWDDLDWEVKHQIATLIQRTIS